MSDHPQPVAASDASLEGLRRLEAQLGDVQAALGRLENGSYGSCSACGSEIADAVLVEAPAATLCGSCRPPGH
jgi:RNA polymerase-binding transcription factor DksA